MFLHTTILILVGVYLFQGIRTLISLRRSFGFVAKATQGSRHNYKKGKLHILIPCLQEQQNISETLAFFYESTESIRDHCHIYTITTEVERKYKANRYTWDVVDEQIKAKNYKNVHNIHYPKTSGYMAHQLNFALEHLESEKNIESSEYIALYNADSRPHPETFAWVLNDCAEANTAPVYQQLSVVFKNLDHFGNGFRGLLLKAFAVWQTRFSLVHELPRLRRTVSKNEFIRTHSNAHCIGHGLFIPAGTIKKLGGFSETTVTEDLFLGYLLRASGVAIKPIPYFENIDSPTTVWRNLRQKYIWYWGPMFYPYYYNHYRKLFNQSRHSLRGIILMLQGVWSAAAWALSGPLLVIALILGIINFSQPIGALLLALLFIYAPLQYYLIMRRYPWLIQHSVSQTVEPRSFWEQVGVALVSPFAILLYSLPPYVSLLMEARKRILKTSITKPKTES